MTFIAKGFFNYYNFLNITNPLVIFWTRIKCSYQNPKITIQNIKNSMTTYYYARKVCLQNDVNEYRQRIFTKSIKNIK